MKRLFSILIILLATCFTCMSQNTRVISLLFNKDHFTIKPSTRGAYLSSDTYHTILKDDAEAPALPYVCTNIAIGANEEFAGFSYEEDEELFGEGILLAHNPILVTTNAKSNSYYNETNTFPATCYPNKTIEYTGTDYYKGCKFLSFLVCPFRYDVNEKGIYIKNRLNLKLKFIQSSDSLTNNDHSLSSIKDFKEFVFNSDAVDSLYPIPISANRTAPQTISDVPYRYIIVTHDSLKNEFQRLADWKTEKGYKAKVITVDSIYQKYTAGNSGNHQLQIKNALYDYWCNSNHKLDYVLLGGSSDIVPVQVCNPKITIDNITIIGYQPSDLFYSCMSVMDWDKDRDNKYAELEDSVSLTPSFNIARLSVTNVNESRSIVDRILKYEINPDTIGWKNDILLCGVKLKYNVANELGDSISDAEYISEQMYTQYIGNTNWSGNKYRFYDTGTDNDAGAAYEVNSNNLQLELQKGYAFVNTNTHGYENRWKLENNSDYTNFNANNLIAPRYSLITTQACYTNDFSDSSCLGSAFIKNPNSNVIGYYGSTSLNIGYLGIVGPSENYTGSFLHYLINEKKSIGQSITFTKEEYNANWNTDTSERWLQLYLNAQCDPEMHIYTEKPTVIDDISLQLERDYVKFNHGLYSTFEACMMSRHDMGQTFYDYLQEIHSGEVYLGGDSTSEHLLTITSPNRIPFRAIHGDNVFIQNESLDNNLGILSYSAEIGSNVTMSRDYGPVSVKNGKSVIKCLNGMTIFNDFDVEPGAELEIVSF